MTADHGVSLPRNPPKSSVKLRHQLTASPVGQQNLPYTKVMQVSSRTLLLALIKQGQTLVLALPKMFAKELSVVRKLHHLAKWNFLQLSIACISPPKDRPFFSHFAGTFHRPPICHPKLRGAFSKTVVQNSTSNGVHSTPVETLKKTDPAHCQALGKVSLRCLSSTEAKEVFPRGWLEKEGLQESSLKDLEQKGILKNHDNTSFSFIRSEDRDSFAAHLLITYSEDNLKDFILENRLDTRFKGVLAQLGRLLWRTCQGDFSQKVKTIKGRFFDHLYEKSHPVSTIRLGLLLHCLKSCDDRDLEEKLWVTYDIEKTITRMMGVFTPPFHQTFSTYIRASARVYHLAFRKLNDYFDEKDPNVKKGVRWMLPALAQHVKGKDVEKLLKLIEKGLKDQKVKKGGQKALHLLAEHTTKEDFAKVLSWVKEHLSNKAAMTTVPVLAQRIGIDQLDSTLRKRQEQGAGQPSKDGFLSDFLTWVAHNTQEEDVLFSLTSLLQLEKGHVIPRVFSWIREQLKKSEAQSLGLSLFKHAIASVPEVHFAAALDLVSQVVDMKTASS